ncbi:hypothetical protein OCU04_009833 [Sclerotinia nivalis]|uniref:Uncharacterized protein n=1 Tax=Sclerotinia nivalis TaxID=352851 RepID=A0A9X0AJE0_9HELO|nr:hypothetical protein OCU04_009833 [Sclerotinia nivalis]
MVHRFNLDETTPDRATDVELARMLNELCWAIDQRNPVFLAADGTNFHSLVSFVHPNASVYLGGMTSGHINYFKIQISLNLNHFQLQRAQEALQHLRNAFYEGQEVRRNSEVVRINYIPYHPVRSLNVRSSLLGLGFVGEAVSEIRRAFERSELYCEVTDQHGNILQGMVPARPIPPIKRQYFTGWNVMQKLGEE